MNKWYVHYTVNPPNVAKKTRCAAGPYSEDEIFDHKRDIATYAGVTDVCLSEFADPMQTARVGEEV